MIMQNHGGGDDFFSDIPSCPDPTVVNQLNAPMADWRFLPQLIGRPWQRLDSAHRTSDLNPQLLRPAVSAEADSIQCCNTLYFG